MRELEVSAKTIDEAITQALASLGVSRDQVEITVLSDGRPGVFGLGSEEARVRVALLEAPPPPSGAQEAARDSEALVSGEALDVAQEVLEQLLRAMKIDAKVTRYPLTSTEFTFPGVEVLDIKGENLGILIGRRGETLSALQYMVNLIVGRRLEARVQVVVDVEGYRQRREQILKGLALRLAERVRATGQSMSLEPMPAHERRIVHLALADQPDVTTQSLGEGDSRKVVISPKRL